MNPKDKLYIKVAIFNSTIYNLFLILRKFWWARWGHSHWHRA